MSSAAAALSAAAAVLSSRELLDEILQGLDPHSLARAGSCCKAFAIHIQRSELWRLACHRTWPFSATVEGIMDFRAFAKRMANKNRDPPDPTIDLADIQFMLRLTRFTPPVIGEKIEVNPGWAQRGCAEEWCPAVVTETGLPSEFDKKYKNMTTGEYCRVRFDDPIKAGTETMEVPPLGNSAWVRLVKEITILEEPLHGRDLTGGRICKTFAPSLEEAGAPAGFDDEEFKFDGIWKCTVVAFRAYDQKACWLLNDCVWQAGRSYGSDEDDSNEITFNSRKSIDARTNVYTGTGAQRSLVVYGDFGQRASAEKVYFVASLRAVSESALELGLDAVYGGYCSPNEDGYRYYVEEEVEEQDMRPILAAAKWL
jgi:hypothetical protein